MVRDEQQWIRLYKYLDGFRNDFKLEMDALNFRMNHFQNTIFRQEIKRLDARFDRLLTSMDGWTKRWDDDDIERAALTMQVHRHDGWIHQLAAKLLIKLHVS